MYRVLQNTTSLLAFISGAVSCGASLPNAAGSVVADAVGAGVA